MEPVHTRSRFIPARSTVLVMRPIRNSYYPSACSLSSKQPSTDCHPDLLIRRTYHAWVMLSLALRQKGNPYSTRLARAVQTVIFHWHTITPVDMHDAVHLEHLVAVLRTLAVLIRTISTIPATNYTQARLLINKLANVLRTYHKNTDQEKLHAIVDSTEQLYKFFSAL